jgi:hypothetical protein
MRNSVLAVFFITLGIVLILLLFITTFNEMVLRNNFPAWSKTLVQIFNPPEDFFERLTVEPLDIVDGQAGQTVAINHKYVGLHEMGLLFSKFDSNLYGEYNRKYNGKYKFHLLAKIKCFEGDKLLFEQSISDSSPFLGKAGGGFHLIHYKVPNDLPLNETVNCELFVSDLDMALVEKIGPVRFFVGKLSDL